MSLLLYIIALLLCQLPEIILGVRQCPIIGAEWYTNSSVQLRSVISIYNCGM